MGYIAPVYSYSKSSHEVPGSSKNDRLVDLYNQYFEVIHAESTEQIRECFRLRYQVYCVENAFEDPLQNPGGLETDEFDSAALHSMLRHRPSGKIVGTVRLLLPDDKKVGMGLPMRQICRHGLMSHDNSFLHWASTAEISRFAVSKMMRRRAGDGAVVGNFEASDQDPRRRIPDTSLGLMQAVLEMAAKSGMTHICAVMEPMLLRMLRRFGMVMPSIGPEVDYHGRRQPCYGHLDTGLARVWIQRPDVWELLTSNGKSWPLNKDAVRKLRAAQHHSESQPYHSGPESRAGADDDVVPLI
jgi:N-acyl amino acid synthase of PEP-CTERM/exosortase system